MERGIWALARLTLGGGIPACAGMTVMEPGRDAGELTIAGEKATLLVTQVMGGGLWIRGRS